MNMLKEKEGKKPAKPRKLTAPLIKTKKLKNSSLPKNWKWVEFTNLCKVITDGDHQAPPKADKGIPFIVISNIKSLTNEINSKFFIFNI